MSDAVEARAAVRFGRCCETKHQWDEATRWYRHVWSLRGLDPAIDEHVAHAAHNLGWLRSQAGYVDQALDWYARAYALRNSGPAAFEAAHLAALARGRLHAKKGQHEDAKWWSGHALFDGEGWFSNGMRDNDPPLILAPDEMKRLNADWRAWYDFLASPPARDAGRAEAAIGRLYQLSRRAQPRVVWCETRSECSERVASLGGHPLSIDDLFPEWGDLRWHHRSQLGRSTRLTDHRTVSRHLQHCLLVQDATRHGGYDAYNHFRGRLDAALLLLPTFYRDALGVRYPPCLSEALDAWTQATRRIDIWVPFSRVCIACDSVAPVPTPSTSSPTPSAAANGAACRASMHGFDVRAPRRRDCRRSLVAAAQAASTTR